MTEQVDNVATPGVDITVSTQENEEMRTALDDAILEFRSVSITCRPRLPRLPINKRNMALVGALDCLLDPYLRSSQDLADTHSILYCAAIATCRVAHVKFLGNDRVTYPANSVPAWQLRIERRINAARTFIGKLICFRSGNNRPRVMRFVNQAFAGTNIRPQEYITWVTERIDFLKQKVYAWAKRITRYRERMDRFYQNRIF